MKLSELTKDDVVFEEKPASAKPLKLSELGSGDMVSFDNEPVKKYTKTESGLMGGAQSVLFDFADEGLGAARAAGDVLSGTPDSFDNFKKNYKKYRNEARKDFSEAQKQNPWSYLGGSLAGAAIIPGAVGLKGATVLGAMGRGALAGGAQGLVSGVGASEDESASGVAKDSVWGGIKGTAGGAIAGGAFNILGRAATKTGRAGLVDEMASFKRGASAPTERGVIESIPGVGPAATKITEGLKETVTGAKAREDFRQMVDTQKQVLTSKLAEESGGDPMQIKKSIDGMSDDEFVLRSLLDEGDNEVKKWVSRTAANQPGQIDADEYSKILSMGPDTRNAARDFTKNKPLIANEMGGLVKDANTQMKGAIKSRVGELSGDAENNFSGDIDNLWFNLDEALRDSVSMKSIPKTVSTRLEDATNLLVDGQAPSHYGLKAANYIDVDNTEKFRRLQKFRETLDKGIDWDAIKTQKRKPDEGEEILMGLRRSVDDILKSTPAKTQADEVYKLGEELRRAVFKRTELKGGVDEYKISRLFNNTDEGNRFRQALSDLKNWADDPQYAPEARKAASDLVQKFDSVYKLADNARSLQAMRYRQGPTSPAVERLGGQINKNTLVQDAVRNPASFVNSADQFVKNYSQQFAGKSFKELSEAEKSALIKTWVKVKAEGDKGTVLAPETVKSYYDKLLGGSKYGMFALPAMGLGGMEDKKKVEEKDYVKAELPRTGPAQQVAGFLDTLFGSDRIGLDPGEKLPEGETTEYDMAVAMPSGPKLSQFRKLVNKVKAGSKLSEAESKALAALRKEYGSPLAVKEGKSTGPSEVSLAQVAPLDGGITEREKSVERGRKMREESEKKWFDRKDAEHKERLKLPKHPDLDETGGSIYMKVHNYLEKMRKDPNYGYTNTHNIHPEGGRDITDSLGMYEGDLSFLIGRKEDKVYDQALQEFTSKIGRGLWEMTDDQKKSFQNYYKQSLANSVTDDLIDSRWKAKRNEYHHELAKEKDSYQKLADKKNAGEQLSGDEIDWFDALKRSLRIDDKPKPKEKPVSSTGVPNLRAVKAVKEETLADRTEKIRQSLKSIEDEMSFKKDVLTEDRPIFKVFQKLVESEKKDKLNSKGKKIGSEGKTGIHSEGGVYKGATMHPRTEGGVMVQPDSYNYHWEGPELRFKTEDEAKKFLDSLKKKTQEEIDNSDIPF